MLCNLVVGSELGAAALMQSKVSYRKREEEESVV